jgi:hypothetical protein
VLITSPSKRDAARVVRERKTVTAMLRIFCRRHHGGGRDFCEACTELHAYAMCRLDRCPFGTEKPTCAACPIHCYRADRQDEIRKVMRYAGPRMLWHHPVLAIRHMLDGHRTSTARWDKNVGTSSQAIDAKGSHDTQQH